MMARDVSGPKPNEEEDWAGTGTGGRAAAAAAIPSDEDAEETSRPSEIEAVGLLDTASPRFIVDKHL